MGHSAGATHVASDVLDKSLHPEEGPGVAAAILVSRLYRVMPDVLAPNLTAYFGSDASQFATRLPITHVAESKCRSSSPWSSMIRRSSRRRAWSSPPRSAPATANARASPGSKAHYHISEIASINTRDDGLGWQIVNFVSTFR